MIQQHKNTRIIHNDQQKGAKSMLKNCLKALHYSNNVTQHPSISQWLLGKDFPFQCTKSFHKHFALATQGVVQVTKDRFIFYSNAHLNHYIISID
jgi:hypothetical protein